MNNLKNDSYYVGKALEQIYHINEHLNSIDSLDMFLKDKMRVDAVMFRLVQLVEHIKDLSQQYKDCYPNIPWGDIIGFRNGIVHEYGATDYTKVWSILMYDIPELQNLFESTLNS